MPVDSQIKLWGEDMSGIYKNVTLLPKKQGLLPRPRLDELLLKAMNHNLVTVIAGAGYGKSQGVSMFLHDSDFHVVWLQLSQLDNFQTRFWEEFVYGVSLHDENAADQLLRLGFPDSLAKFNKLLYILDQEVFIGHKFVIVFDDFHLIHNDYVINFVESLVLAKLDNLCVLLISRTDLDFSSVLYTENRISAEDLCFTPDETADYFKMHDITLRETEYERIHTYTGGWPLAIYLVELTIKKGEEEFTDPISGATPIIFRMIENELFSSYTPQVQELLVKLSLLDDFRLNLVRVLSSEDINAITEIISTNMFIYYNPYTKNYNFHNLFSEFLKAKQISLKEEQITETYLNAAEWYAKNSLNLDAVIYYKRCKSYEKIWEIIRCYKIDIPPEEAELFLELIEAFPKEILEKHPLIGVAYGRLLLNNGRLAEAENRLLEIKENYEALPPTPENKAVIGEACIFLAMLSLAMRDYRFAGLFKTAAQCLPDGSVFVDNRLYLNNGNYAVTIEKPDAGELEKFERAIVRAMPCAAKAMNGCGYGAEYLTLAESAYYKGNMAKAESEAYNALYKARQQRQNDVVCGAYFTLMRRSVAQGNYPKAAAFLNEISETIEKPNDVDCLSIIDVIKGWFYGKLGDIKKIPQWIMNEEQSNKILSPNTIGKDRLIRAQCFLESENYIELLAFLKYLEKFYDEKGFLMPKLEVQILKAIAAHKAHDVAASMTAFRYAYDLSHANLLIMPFIQYGSHMRSVIDTVKRNGNCSIPVQWLDKIHAKASTYAKRLNNVQAQYQKSIGLLENYKVTLTKRENELLQCICHGLTQKEISESLYISVGTVKNMSQNIYNKLGALNSSDAVRIAVQMGLLQ